MHADVAGRAESDTIQRGSGLSGIAAKGNESGRTPLGGGFMPFVKAFSDCAVVRLVAMAALAWPLASCAARQVTPVAMTQPTDGRLTCSEIDQEMKSNQATAAELLQKNQEVDQANAAKVVASVVLSGWIALTVDLSHEEQIKMRALSDRNEALASLKTKKRCAA
jgi:hypothetical protein